MTGPEQRVAMDNPSLARDSLADRSFPATLAATHYSPDHDR